MPSPDQIDPTLSPDAFTPADPFDGTDPVNLHELGGEFRAWRAVLDLLARTGEALHIPDAYLPDTVMLNVAAGWHYMPTLRRAAGTHVLTCKYTGWNPRDLDANFRPGSPFHDRTTGPADAEERARQQLADAGFPTVQPDPAEIAEDVAAIARRDARLREQEEGRDDPQTDPRHDHP